jgi:long-chain fatty acid transport protein
MKRLLLFSLSVLISGILLAGGIVTNQNQSAMYTRLQARDATLGIDAVFYNPAGLSLLPNNGFYLSLNNQSLNQNRTVNTDYAALNENEFKGSVKAPFFPGFYAAYKLDKLAFSFGFNPIGGGGGGIYDKGLPSFEYSIADLVPALQLQGQDVRAYRLDAYFEGSSVFFGYQANVSYQINDMISVAVGGRFVSAKEAYNGYLKSVEIDREGNWITATSFFQGSATKAEQGLQGLSTAGLGAATLDDALTLGYITQEEYNGMAGGLSNPTVTIDEGLAIYNAGADGYTARSVLLDDQAADYTKTATGFTPIISVNIKASDKLNLSLKYEHKTSLEFTNKTTEDFTVGFDPTTGAPITMFPDGAKTNLDIPALLVVGATYKPIEKLLISTGFHYYFDKNANWDGKEELLDGNTWEFALGAEYSISEKILVSAGWMRNKSYAQEAYQSDLSQALPGNTFGGGLAYKVLPMLEVNLAGSYTKYEEVSKDFTHDFAGSGAFVPIQESYTKPVLIFSLGLNFNFSAGK